jgi:hypothetical protein
MDSKSKLLVFTTLSLLCASFVLIAPCQAYSSPSFDTNTGSEYVWEVSRINVAYFVDPYLDALGDRLKLVITTANTTEIGGVTYDSIYGKLYHNNESDRTWIQIGGPEAALLAIFNGTYLEVFSDLPYILSRDESINTDWMFDNFLHYSSKSATTAYQFRIYISKVSGPSVGDPYEEYDYVDGVLFSWGFARWNGTAWDVHTLIAKSSSGGVPGFQILPTLLAVTGFLAIYTLLLRKKLQISL